MSIVQRTTDPPELGTDLRIGAWIGRIWIWILNYYGRSPVRNCITRKHS